jgi:hypothetical protein
MHAALIPVIVELGAHAINGILEYARSQGATPEQLQDLRKRIVEQSAASDSRYDSAQAAADARIAARS